MGNGAAFQSVTLSASTHKLAWVFSFPGPGDTITSLMFRYTLRTGTPPTYLVSLQSLDATTGFPSTTVLGGGSPASATFTPPASTAWDSTIQTVALANSLAVTRGQLMAMVIEYSSGTINGSNNSAFTRDWSLALHNNRSTLPYPLVDSGAGYVKTVNSSFDVFGLKSSTRTYGQIVKSVTTNDITSNGNRIALALKIPAGFSSAIKLAGIRYFGSPPAAAKNWIAGVWNSAGTVIINRSVDSDISGQPGGTNRFTEIYFDTAPVPVSVGTTYYIGVERVDAQLSVQSQDIDTSGDGDTSGFGQNAFMATWNGSAWSSVLTSLPLIEPILEDVSFNGTILA